MGAHINKDGRFQSDKYPTTPPGKVPLSVQDTTAQDLLWEYAQRRRGVDAEFASDLETCLRAAGFDPSESVVGDPSPLLPLKSDAEWLAEWQGGMARIESLPGDTPAMMLSFARWMIRAVQRDTLTRAIDAAHLHDGHLAAGRREAVGALMPERGETPLGG